MFPNLYVKIVCLDCFNAKDFKRFQFWKGYMPRFQFKSHCKGFIDWFQCKGFNLIVSLFHCKVLMQRFQLKNHSIGFINRLVSRQSFTDKILKAKVSNKKSLAWFIFIDLVLCWMFWMLISRFKYKGFTVTLYNCKDLRFSVLKFGCKY